MNINCLCCGHSFDLRDAYDDYEGPVRCYICGTLLAIRTDDGEVKEVDMARVPREAVATAAEQTE